MTYKFTMKQHGIQYMIKYGSFINIFIQCIHVIISNPIFKILHTIDTMVVLRNEMSVNMITKVEYMNALVFKLAYTHIIIYHAITYYQGHVLDNTIARTSFP